MASQLENAIDNYVKTIKQFDTLLAQFEVYLAAQNWGGTIDTQRTSHVFEILGERVEATIIPRQEEQVIGYVEFAWVAQGARPTPHRIQLLGFYLNKYGEGGFELDEADHFIMRFKIDDSLSTETQIYKRILKQLLSVFGIETR